MSEPLSVAKFVGSFADPLSWIKNIRFIAGAALILFLLFTLYRAYFVKNKTTMIRVEKGATANIYEVGDKKKEIANCIPYLDASYGRFNNGFDSWNDGEDGWEVRAGIRIEFDGLFDFLFRHK